MTKQHLSWLDIVRLGLVQTALGGIVVLTTSTLNRVMVVELALPAMVPGFLVALHYAVQMSRPRWGYGSDVGGRRTPWIVGGIAVLGLGAVLAALSVAIYPGQPTAASVMAVIAFVLVGVGVGASGTSLLAFLATHVAPARRPAAAATVWLMMIAGFIITAAIAGSLLDPYTPTRLVEVTIGVASAALVVATLAIWGLEGKMAPNTAAKRSEATQRSTGAFFEALSEVWSEPKARRFTIFVFVSMLAFSAQDLILEPFAGLVFKMTPGETTKLSGVQHSGVFTGMLLIGIAGSWLSKRYSGTMRAFTVIGCIMSSVALILLCIAGTVGPGWPLVETVFLLGFANGVFAVAAIGSMMGLAGAGRENREGTRMGLWGAAQAIAFGLGGFLGTVAVDLMRSLIDTVSTAYAIVFLAEGLLFLLAAALAARISVEALQRSETYDELGQVTRA